MHVVPIVGLIIARTVWP